MGEVEIWVVVGAWEFRQVSLGVVDYGNGKLGLRVVFGVL